MLEIPREREAGMNYNHMKEILIGSGLQAMQVSVKWLLFQCVWSSSSFVFCPKVAAHVLLLFGMLLIAFNTVETWSVSRALKIL